MGEKGSKNELAWILEFSLSMGYGILFTAPFTREE